MNDALPGILKTEDIEIFHPTFQGQRFGMPGLKRFDQPVEILLCGPQQQKNFFNFEIRNSDRGFTSVFLV
jgi:hypothetical protein